MWKPGYSSIIAEHAINIIIVSLPLCRKDHFDELPDIQTKEIYKLINHHNNWKVTFSKDVTKQKLCFILFFSSWVRLRVPWILVIFLFCWNFLQKKFWINCLYKNSNIWSWLKGGEPIVGWALVNKTESLLRTSGRWRHLLFKF